MTDIPSNPDLDSEPRADQCRYRYCPHLPARFVSLPTITGTDRVSVTAQLTGIGILFVLFNNYFAQE